MRKMDRVRELLVLEIKQTSGGVQKPEHVRNLLAISSGKGGVGKTTITLQLAMALGEKGVRVGILDVDIYGPNVMAFVPGPIEKSSTLDPIYFENIPIVSMAMLVNADQALMWRGPMIAKAAMQLALSTTWPELDLLLVDFPPGTGDVHLSLLSQLGWLGYVLVTTPHVMAADDAVRVRQLFNHYKISPLLTIANLHHIDCFSCGHRMHLLGAATEGVPVGYHEEWMKGKRSSEEDYAWVEEIWAKLQGLSAAEAQGRKKINIAIKEIK